MQNSNCRVFTLFGTFHCRCCRDCSVKFSNFTFDMHKTKDSVFLFCFSVSLFLDTVVLRIQLRENPPKCNNLNEMEYSHEVSNSVNWLLKWRFRCHRYRGWVSTLLQDHRKLLLVKCRKLRWQLWASPIEFFNPVIPRQIFPQTRYPDGYYPHPAFRIPPCIFSTPNLSPILLRNPELRPSNRANSQIPKTSWGICWRSSVVNSLRRKNKMFFH